MLIEWLVSQLLVTWKVHFLLAFHEIERRKLANLQYYGHIHWMCGWVSETVNRKLLIKAMCIECSHTVLIVNHCILHNLHTCHRWINVEKGFKYLISVPFNPQVFAQSSVKRFLDVPRQWPTAILPIGNINNGYWDQHGQTNQIECIAVEHHYCNEENWNRITSLPIHTSVSCA